CGNGFESPQGHFPPRAHGRPPAGFRASDRTPMSNIPWWGYVIGAGLAWGTYVPLVFYGGTELTTRPGTIGRRLASILCVGVGYFVLAVVVPVVLMAVRVDAKPDGTTTGLVVSGPGG